MTAGHVELGLRENRAQFVLLVAVNAFVGAMVGLERSTLPLIGSHDFGLTSKAAVLSFIVAFGAAKALTNLGAGALAQRLRRRRLLIAGWVVALPVPLLVAVAPSWAWIVAANALLGVNQGLAWSMTVVMKIDLVGPRRRGLALGLNEAAGYGGVALMAGLTGLLAGAFAARDVLVVAGAVIAVVALVISALFVRDTAAHVALEQSQQHPGARVAAPALREAFGDATWRVPALRACSQAGLVNNLNDALAWGLVPLFLAAHGASVRQIGLVAGIYPAVWGRRADRHRPLVRPRRAKAADRRRDAHPGLRARAAHRLCWDRRDRRRLRGPARRRHRARLPNPDRRHLRRHHPSRSGTRRRRLPLLARLRLRCWRPGRRDRRRRTRLRWRDRDRRRAHRRLWALGRLRPPGNAGKPRGDGRRRARHGRVLTGRARAALRDARDASLARPRGPAELPGHQQTTAPAADKVADARAELRKLATLSERQRRLILLHAFGFSWAEIADRLGVKPSSVEDALYRACRKLSLN